MPEPPDAVGHSPRLSLTRRQLETRIGSELLGVLQSVTADGQLTDTGIRGLVQWLDSHADQPLPAIAYLRGVVQRVLGVGQVTPQAWTAPERHDLLYRAIERALPPELRDEAAMRRREAKAETRQHEAEERERQHQDRESRRAIEHLDFMVAGFGHEGRQEIIRRYVREDESAYLVREPSNPYSSNAVLVLLENGVDIGYVPEELARKIAPLLDQSAKQRASIKDVLHGPHGLIPIIGGSLYAPDAPVDDALGPAELPKWSRQHEPPPPAPAAPAPQGQAAAPHPTPPAPQAATARSERYTCKRCNRVSTVPERYWGRDLKCPGCGEPFTIPVNPHHVGPVVTLALLDVSVETFGLHVAGTSFRQETLRRIAGVRAAAGNEAEFAAIILPEPDNPADPGALAVYAKDYGHIGYLRREEATLYHRAVMALGKAGKAALCRARLVGGTTDFPILGAVLAVPAPDRFIDLVSEATVTAGS